MILPQSFYTHDDVVQISKDLLGKMLVSEIAGEVCSGMIVETEAYRAPDDQACHAYLNRNTNRTKTMFLEGGVAYIYICYGIHQMINIVTSAEGNAHAVLIRSIEPADGQVIQARRRGHSKMKLATVNGPGKLAQALGVDTSMDGVSLYDPLSPIRIEDQEIIITDQEIISGPRVGMSIHVGSDAHRPWRFTIADNKWVSNPKVARYPRIPVR